MTTDLDRIIERHYRAQDALKHVQAKLLLELAGKVADDAAGAALRQKFEEEHADVLEEAIAAVIAYEQSMADLRRREVEAHERNSAFWTLQRERA